jgi:SH3-like domain-containing protein
MKKDRVKSVFLVFLVVFIFFSTLLIQKIYNLETDEFGVILSDKVSLYSEPTDNSTELFVLHEGSKVEILRSANSWYEIRLVDGKTGWIDQSALQII